MAPAYQTDFSSTARILTNAYRSFGNSPDILDKLVILGNNIPDMLERVGRERISLNEFRPVPSYVRTHLMDGQPKELAPEIKHYLNGDIPPAIGDAIVLAAWGRIVPATLTPGEQRVDLNLAVDIANAVLGSYAADGFQHLTPNNIHQFIAEHDLRPREKQMYDLFKWRHHISSHDKNVLLYRQPDNSLPPRQLTLSDKWLQSLIGKHI